MLPLAVNFTAPDNAVFIGVVALACVMILSAVDKITAIQARYRKTPPDDQTFGKINAELATLSNRVTENRIQIDAVESRSNTRSTTNAAAIAQLESRLETKLTDFERRLTSDISSNRENSEHRFGSIEGKLDAMQISLQSIVKEVYRALGRVEGERQG